MSSFKHSCFMNVKYHYVRHAVETKEIILYDVRSEDNTDDLFTKRLNKKTLTYLKSCFMEAYSKREVLDKEEESSSNSD